MLRSGLIATKVGNSSFYKDNGMSTHVTILKIDECIVSNVKTKEKGSADKPRKHWNDPSGKSLTFGTDFYLNESPENGPVIRTNCTDWSSELETSRNLVDHLGKTINLKEYNLFLIKMYSGG